MFLAHTPHLMPYRSNTLVIVNIDSLMPYPLRHFSRTSLFRQSPHFITIFIFEAVYFSSRASGFDVVRLISRKPPAELLRGYSIVILLLRSPLSSKRASPRLLRIFIV